MQHLKDRKWTDVIRRTPPPARHCRQRDTPWRSFLRAGVKQWCPRRPAQSGRRTLTPMTLDQAGTGQQRSVSASCAQCSAAAVQCTSVHTCLFVNCRSLTAVSDRTRPSLTPLKPRTLISHRQAGAWRMNEVTSLLFPLFLQQDPFFVSDSLLSRSRSVFLVLASVWRSNLGSFMPFVSSSALTNERLCLLVFFVCAHFSFYSGCLAWNEYAVSHHSLIHPARGISRASVLNVHLHARAGEWLAFTWATWARGLLNRTFSASLSALESCGMCG